jgi:putative IMPACT (imprinted ancient) family translation regulator
MRQVLAELPRAKKLTTTTLLFVVPYALFERAQIVIANFNGFCIEKNFAADVTLSVRLPNDHLEAFKDRIIALTQGQVEFITIETRDNTIIPIK